MIIVAYILLYFPFFALSEPIELAEGTFSQYINDNKIVFVAFTVGWCPFSNAMKTVLTNTDEKLSTQSKLNESVKIATIDCIANSGFCDNNRINKFPTLFVYTRGVKITEYREERSVDAILFRLENLLEDKSVRLSKSFDLQQLKEKKKNFLVGFFSQTPPDQIASFVALLRDFYVAVNFSEEMRNGESIRYYNAKEDSWIYFPGEMSDYSLLGDWVKKITREKITYMNFQNAEEITGERKPLVVLFLSDGKEEMLEAFERQFDSLLYQIADNVNFVYVDCRLFEHPLYYIGKTVEDCPMLIIDSLAHMYLFPGDIRDALKNDMTQLVEFLNDFLSGKLHKKLHNLDTSDIAENDNILKLGNVTPKESKFKDLAPSANRYSFLDEL